MVKLGKGQAILGGSKTNGNSETKIYLMTCSNKNCILLLVNRELSVPNYFFVAIPIPDTISGCITGGKKFFQKIPNDLGHFHLVNIYKDCYKSHDLL